MDDLNMSGEALIDTLNQIARINKWLGGNRVIINGLDQLLKNGNSQNNYQNQTLRIVDLGCGNGDILRRIANYGRKKGYKFQLLGIDANPATIAYAQKLSAHFPEITYSQEDVLAKDFKNHTYDIAISTLFLHHFDDEEVLNLIQVLTKNAQLGVLINDLHRHRLPYYLFKILTSGIKNKMTRKDGLTSILRAFKREDFERFSTAIKHNSTISWRWAFRFQWIINKT